MLNARALFLLGILLVCHCRIALAQSYDFVNYNVENGLTQSNVTDIIQDSRGYLWIGTNGGGLNRFDGVTFREYSLKDNVPGQIISSIAEAPNGDIWVGSTWGGAGRYDGKSFELFNKDFGLTSNCVLSLLCAGDKVYMGTPDGGIYEYSYTTRQHKRISTLRDVASMCSDNQGRVWIASGNKLACMQNGKITNVPLPGPAENHKTINHITCSPDGHLYLGTENGLLIYHLSSAKFIDNFPVRLLKGENVTDLLFTADKKTLISTQSGKLFIIPQNEEKYKVYDEANGLITGGIPCLYQDQSQHIWIGSSGFGLIRWRSEAFTYYPNTPGLNANDIFRIFEDSRNRILTGSYSQGLYSFENGVSKPILNGNTKFDQPVAIVEDKNQHLWIGHRNGVTRLVNDKPVQSILPGKRVRALCFDRKGNLWIGTWGDGAYKYDGNTLEQFTEQNGQLPQNYVHAILEDRKGRIWMGTGAGVCCYDGKSFQSFSENYGLCNSYVGSLRQDQKGNIWMHTDRCVSWFDGKKFHNISENEGLLSNTTYFIEFDRLGRLWVGTNKGVDRVLLDENNNVKTVYHYTMSNGFRGIECNSRAVTTDHTGALWFGTIKGLINYSPASDRIIKNTSNVYVTDIRLFLEETNWTSYGKGKTDWFNLPEQVTLPADKNHLTFYFTSLQLHNPQNTRYMFMLSGFDSTWQPVTEISQITYSNLPPGEYRFHVKAGNADNMWNPNPASSALITILPPPPPFWRSWWFFSILLCLLGAVLYYVFVVRARLVRKQREMLETQIAERTQEISRQNEEKSVMLKEIHHRVKNNLQVISSLLNLQAEGITDERVLTLFEDCRHRVNSMALIHEKMYQSHNLVNIDINSYIDELMHSLVDAYDTDKTIHLKTDVENLPFRIDTIVPLGLILNEIISNAMKYAFRGLAEGTIMVRLQKTGENEYMLEAGDNGRGLPAGFDLSKASSLGMQLIVMLSEQLSGHVEMVKGTGTVYKIHFREEVKDRF
ncbi:MAG: hypothetical protein MUC87_04835 [Bacteroidia bacterium]|nr:hypothetical protein [Bacteroidia bacterium]